MFFTNTLLRSCWCAGRRWRCCCLAWSKNGKLECEKTQTRWRSFLTVRCTRRRGKSVFEGGEGGHAPHRCVGAWRGARQWKRAGREKGGHGGEKSGCREKRGEVEEGTRKSTQGNSQPAPKPFGQVFTRARVRACVCALASRSWAALFHALPSYSASRFIAAAVHNVIVGEKDRQAGCERTAPGLTLACPLPRLGRRTASSTCGAASIPHLSSWLSSLFSPSQTLFVAHVLLCFYLAFRFLWLLFHGAQRWITRQNYRPPSQQQRAHHEVDKPPPSSRQKDRRSAPLPCVLPLKQGSRARSLGTLPRASTAQRPTRQQLGGKKEKQNERRARGRIIDPVFLFPISSTAFSAKAPERLSCAAHCHAPVPKAGLRRSGHTHTHTRHHRKATCMCVCVCWLKQRKDRDSADARKVPAPRAFTSATTTASDQKKKNEKSAGTTTRDTEEEAEKKKRQTTKGRHRRNAKGRRSVKNKQQRKKSEGKLTCLQPVAHRALVPNSGVARWPHPWNRKGTTSWTLTAWERDPGGTESSTGDGEGPRCPATATCNQCEERKKVDATELHVRNFLSFPFFDNTTFTYDDGAVKQTNAIKKSEWVPRASEAPFT